MHRETRQKAKAMRVLGRIGKDLIPFGAVLLMMAATPAAQAANLNIDDSVEGQITLRHDANWEFGVTSNGTPFAPFAAGSTTVPGELGAFSGGWIVNAPGSPDPGQGVIYLVDPADPNLVSDIVSASWTTDALDANIDIRVQSSACGQNLGRLPAAFSGFGVPDPDGSIAIQGLFRDPVTAAPVSIPSNLTIQFVSAADDCDGDGVPDVEDLCLGTVLPEGVPTVRLGTNRFADVDGDGIFDTTPPNGKGPKRSFTIQDTGGCSCEQIIDELGLGKGHEKFGCSISAMEDWIASLTP